MCLLRLLTSYLHRKARVFLCLLLNYWGIGTWWPTEEVVQESDRGSYRQTIWNELVSEANQG